MAVREFTGELDKPTTSVKEFSGELDPPKVQQGKAPPGFLDEHPNVRTALQFGVPLATTVAAMPFTAGMSLPLAMGTEMMASLGGEVFNQATGISEKDNMQLGLAFAAPGVGKATGGILGNIPRLFPGYGEALRAAFTDDMRKLPKSLLGGDDLQSLYASIARGNMKHRFGSFPNLEKAVDGITKEVDAIPFEQLRKDLRTEGLENILEQITGTLKGSGPKMAMAPPIVSGKATNTLPTGLPSQAIQVAPGRAPGLTFEEVDASVKGFGKIIGRTTDPVLRGQYQQLYKGLLKDLETSNPPAGVPLKEWTQAREVYKRQYAETALTEATERAIKTRDGVDIVDPNKKMAINRQRKWKSNGDGTGQHIKEDKDGR